MFKKIFKILHPAERKKFGWLVFLDIVVSILDIAFLIILLAVINFYTQPGASPGFLSFTGTILKQYPLLLVIGYFILFIIKNSFAFFVTKMQYRFIYGVASACSKQKLSAYLSGDYPDFVKIDSSILIRSINQQPIEFAHYVLRGLQQVISQSVLIVLTVTAILIYNAFLFTLLLLILLPPIVLMGWIIRKRLAASRKAGKNTSELSLQHLQEALAGYVEGNIYHREEFFVSRYHKKQDKLNGYLAEQQVIQNLPPRFMEVFAMLGLAVLVCIHYASSSSTTIDVLIIGAFVAAAYKIIPGVVKILNGLGQMKTYEYTVADLLKMKEDQDACRGGACLRPLPHQNFSANRAEASPAPTIQLNTLSFRYHEKHIIDNFSAEINSGDFIVIFGKSGSGKTTLINLLLGLLSPQSGGISIDHQLQQNGLRSYWNRISYSKQQPFFIYDTIGRNITFEETNINHKKLAEVLAVTGAADFAERENHPVTENGKNLSGGQSQRILFARALYKEHDILILDEPFNELDETAESGLLEYLKQLAQTGRIVLLITHNIQAFKYCNKKIDLDA